MKAVERKQARQLRASGLGMSQIAERLGVSKSSVSVWTRDVELTSEQRAAIGASPARVRGTEVRKRRAREARAAFQAAGRELARGGDPLHVAGCMLYWGEGSKERNCVVFTNAEIAMHQHFLRFLRECYAVTDDRVAFSVNCFLGNGLELADIEAYWLQRLDLPPTALRKASVNRASRASKRVRPPLLHGTGRLVVHSTELVQSIYGAIQEYTGHDHPEWLD